MFSAASSARTTHNRENWSYGVLRQSNPEFLERFPKYGTNSHYNTLLPQQNIIGWDQFLRGKLGQRAANEVTEVAEPSKQLWRVSMYTKKVIVFRQRCVPFPIPYIVLIDFDVAPISYGVVALVIVVVVFG